MPVTMIPQKSHDVPQSELSASEKMIGYMTEAKKPTAGKAISATGPLPKNARLRQIKAATVKAISTFRLSINFK
jgi:hypothetical protein